MQSMQGSMLPGSRLLQRRASISLTTTLSWEAANDGIIKALQNGDQLAGPVLAHSHGADPPVEHVHQVQDATCARKSFPHWGRLLGIPYQAQEAWADHADRPGTVFLVWLLCILLANALFFCTFYIGSQMLHQNIVALAKLPSATGMVVAVWIIGPDFLKSNQGGRTWYLAGSCPCW